MTDGGEEGTPPLGASLMKAGLLVALVGGGYALARSLGLVALERDGARAWVEAQGVWALVLAPLVYGVGVAAFVPGAALTLACGFAFGLGRGVVVAWLGANLGANLAFGLGRWLGRDAVERFFGGERLRKLEARLREGGAAVIVTLRLIPFVPFTALNYGAGVVPGVRWRHYALGTAVGIIPGTAAYTAIGEFPDPERPEFWAAVVVIQLLAAVPIAVTWWRRSPEDRSRSPEG